MHTYDLCLAWNWEYDADFLALLDNACRLRGLGLLQATLRNIYELIEAVTHQQILFRFFWDRASEHDIRFKPLVDWIAKQDITCINAHDKTTRACDKATMHYTLIHAGLHTPYTIILPSYADQPALSTMDLQPLGKRFTIKPAHGGGGEGVIMDASTFDEVRTARQDYPSDHYLLQAHIDPVVLASRPAWFRVIYCTGKSYPCWWDPQTHIYTPVTENEERDLGLTPLHEMVQTIARLSGLEILSTEIALTASGKFVVIDYVNDQIDLRLQSKAADCVPDFIVHDIAERLADFVLQHRSSVRYAAD
jgi:hypothetical protein